jgi:threonine dehydrogenase-like Zn-dependent dehydrogenase
MRAAVMRDRKLVVDRVPEPVPGPGEVLVKTLACGICGSDLHALQHMDKMIAASVESGLPSTIDLRRDMVMGHEFCAEILEFGPGCAKRLPVGSRVCSMPVLLRGGFQAVGYSNEVPGGYAERMVLQELLLLEVPNGLATEHAALTEPMAVGLHAVEKAQMTPRDVPLVIGCGPVGLAVIAALELRGAAPILAADFSPRRRELAARLGADIVIDPAATSPYASWQDAAREGPAGAAPPLLFGAGAGFRPGVIFECVGVPGVLDQILKGSPRGGRVVVAGVCMENDSIRPVLGINKELNVQFVLGYTPEEFARTLGAIAEGRIDVAPLVTGRVGVDGVPGAFQELASPERHAKILVEPWR